MEAPAAEIQIEPTTYSLESPGFSPALWTTPAARLVSGNDSPPAGSGKGLRLWAARNEFEPVKLIFGPGTGSITLEWGGFPHLGADQRFLPAAAGFNSAGLEETLTPVSGSFSLSSQKPTVLWLTAYVPPAAPEGTHVGHLTLKNSLGESADIEVTLRVFDFTLPKELGLRSMMDLAVPASSPEGFDRFYTLLHEHRMVPKSPTGSSGFKYSITWSGWDKNGAHSFDDEASDGVWGLSYQADRYLRGNGWNGTGWPLAQAFQFVNNTTPRPAIFAGFALGPDPKGTAEYNQAWGTWLTALNTYLTAEGYHEKVYYYVQNEPQNQADYDTAAFLLKLTKDAAPDLKCAVSEEPKPEIAEHGQYALSSGKSYDIWIADIQHYDPVYGTERQKLGEEVWFYHNDGTPAPYIMPVDFNLSGAHQRLLAWVLWKYRARGWGYYKASVFFPGGTPNVRAELLRESFEDYEYLLAANGGHQPEPGKVLGVDTSVESAAQSVTSFAQDMDSFQIFRNKLGLFIEGSLGDLPVYRVPSLRPRGDYRINFQDPQGNPDAEPFLWGEKTWMKVGWSPYSPQTGSGFIGGAVGTSRAKYGWYPSSPADPVRGSCVYDDYGKVNLFEFDLEPGDYTVTVGVGRPDRISSDLNNLSVEGVNFLKDFRLSTPTLDVTRHIRLYDGKLSLEFGAPSGQYTFLQFITITSE